MANNDEAYRNGRVVLDVTMSSDKVARIDEMNGHQGDDGRVVKFMVVGQQGQPYDMTGKTIDLVGVDAAGKTKISGNTATMVNPSLGTLDFTIPGAFYQRVGDYDRAYFRIKDSGDQVVSTINVMFSVIQGAGYLTQGDSQIYDAQVDGRLAQIEQKVATFTGQLQGMLSGTTDAAKIARDALNAVLESIKANQVPTLGGNNAFTGQNTFHGTTQIDDLSGNALQQIYNYVNAVKASLEDDESGKQYNFNAWGVNGCVARKDVSCTLIKFNKYVGYCKLEGTFEFPPMKPYTGLEVINVDKEAMRGGIYAMPRLTAQNENNILMFDYNTGDSGQIWMHHQSNSYDATKPDPEYIQIGWFCSWR